MTKPLHDNLDYILHFLTTYRVYTLFFTTKTHIPNEMSLPESSYILQYGNILQYTETQHGIDPYCFTPTTSILYFVYGTL